MHYLLKYFKHLLNKKRLNNIKHYWYDQIHLQIIYNPIENTTILFNF